MNNNNNNQQQQTIQIRKQKNNQKMAIRKHNKQSRHQYYSNRRHTILPRNVVKKLLQEKGINELKFSADASALNRALLEILLDDVCFAIRNEKPKKSVQADVVLREVPLRLTHGHNLCDEDAKNLRSTADTYVDTIAKNEIVRKFARDRAQSMAQSKARAKARETLAAAEPIS